LTGSSKKQIMLDANTCMYSKTINGIFLVCDMNFDEMDIERLRHVARGFWRESLEIEQILGKALDYPWFKDDQKNFPDATEEHGVCVGDHVAITLAMEASDKIKQLKDRVEKLSKRPVTKEEAIAQYHFIKERSQKNKQN